MSDDYRPDRPVFCGNYEYDATEREIVRLFDKYGDVDRIDMKTGFAFVYMKDKRDADVAIRKLDNQEFGYKRRRLRVEWAKQKESDRKRDTKPSTTLFIVNFDTQRIRERDIERHFEPYGRLKRVEIKRNYAFVQFDNLDDAIHAFDKTNGSNLQGRTITVEYTQNDDPGARNYAGDDFARGRSRSRSPPRRARSPSYDRGGRGRSRSRSPPRRSPSPRRDSPRRESPRRESPRRDSPRRDSPRRDSRSRSRSPKRSY